MVLNGTVVAMTDPYLNVNDGKELRSPTPLLSGEKETLVGTAFKKNACLLIGFVAFDEQKK